MLKKFFPVLEHINFPGILTTMGLMMGAVTAYLLMHGELRWAILALFLCGVLDLADGFAASRLNQITKFGQQVDSLVDFFTCCIMPIFMVYLFFYENWLVVGAMAFYAMCGLWRLAYYNILTEQPALPGGRKYFTGLPVPGAMMVITMTFWAVMRFGLPVWLMAIAFVAIGLLMVSYIKLIKYGPWQRILWGVGLIFMGFVLFS